MVNLDLPVGNIVRHRHLLQLGGGCAVSLALELMDKYMRAAVGVVEAGKFVGTFTRGDFVHRVLWCGLHPGRVRVKDVITGDPLVVSPHCAAREAVYLFTETDAYCLPVVDGETLIGILENSDIAPYIDELANVPATDIRAAPAFRRTVA